MVECNSIETTNIYPDLNDQQQFGLKTVNGIKDYCVSEIKKKELMSERISKYIAWLIW